MILFELKLELWKIIQWNKIEFRFQIKPNSDRIWIRIWNKKQGGFFPHGKLIMLSPLKVVHEVLEINPREKIRPKEIRKREKDFQGGGFVIISKLNPNCPIPYINRIWPCHSSLIPRELRNPNLESTRGISLIA